MEIIKKIYDSWNAKRAYMNLVYKHYKGLHFAPELSERRLDGRKKTKVRSGFIGYAVSMYTGFLTSRDVSYTSRYGNENMSSMDAWDEIYSKQSLPLNDTLNLMNALLYGYGVETVRLSDGEIFFDSQSPAYFVPIKDSSNEIVAAVAKIEIPKYTFHNGALLEKDLILYQYYDSEKITTYEENSNKSLEVISEEEHPFGKLPVIFYHINEDGESFFNESILSKCDEFSIVVSSMIDDVKYSIDSLLAIENMDISKLIAKDETGISVLAKIKALGLLPLGDGQKASYLSRNIDTEKFRFALTSIREDLFRSLSIPDLVDKVNASGGVQLNSISGVALRLLFLSMEQSSSQMEKYFVEGLKIRIELTNHIWSITGNTELLTNVDIKLSRNMPSNDIELINSIAQLESLMSKKDRLSLLPFVTNPDLVLFNKEEEVKELDETVTV